MSPSARTRQLITVTRVPRHVTAIIMAICTFGMLLGSSFVSDVSAAPYGSGSYGGGSYNQGETAAAEDSTDSFSASPIDNTTPAEAPHCDATAPGEKKPQLYAAVPESTNTIRLYFTHPDPPYDRYVIRYGTSSGEYQFAVQDITAPELRSFAVGALQPNTSYYFQMRAGNDCAPGAWSNEIQTTTQARGVRHAGYNQLAPAALDDVTPTTQATAAATASDSARVDADETSTLEGYTLSLVIRQKDGSPASDATVTLYSEPRTQSTNADGSVTFTDVAAGQHRLVIETEDGNTEQALYLDGTQERIELEVTLQPSGWNWQLLGLGVLAGASGVLVIGTTIWVVYSRK